MRSLHASRRKRREVPYRQLRSFPLLRRHNPAPSPYFKVMRHSAKVCRIILDLAFSHERPSANPGKCVRPVTRLLCAWAELKSGSAAVGAGYSQSRLRAEQMAKPESIRMACLPISILNSLICSHRRINSRAYSDRPGGSVYAPVRQERRIVFPRVPFRTVTLT